MAGQTRDPTIVVRGGVPDAMVAYAREKTLHVVASTNVPVLAVEVRLDLHGDPARRRPNHVEITLDLDGAPVRAHGNAPTMREAIDGTCARLRRRLGTATERARARTFRHRDERSWHHDDEPTERPAFYPRSASTREVVRRKTFAAHPETIDEALTDLDLLDHDFYLFRHDETGAEAVVYRLDDRYGLMQRAPTEYTSVARGDELEIGPPPVHSIETARSMLDESDAPFVFFIDAVDDTAGVLYRRYDGHYGVITSK